MKFALLDSDLLGVTSDDWTKSEASDFDSKEDFRTEKKAWNIVNAKAKGKIGLMCQKTVQITLEEESTAEDM